LEFIQGFFVKGVLLSLLLVSFFLNLKAQQSSDTDSVSVERDTAVLSTDSVPLNSPDTVTKRSADGLNAEVNYSASDSIRFNKEHNIVYLYGDARISYEDFELIADYIRLDQKNNTLFARGRKDPKTGRYKGRPIFTQNGEPPVTTDSLAFNFKSKKGNAYGTFSEVEGGFIQAAKSKKNQYNEVSIKDAIYSTCNLPHPHFGIHISKGIVAEKNIVTGPAYLVIEDIPFPAIIPFGFFPKANKRASGILFPTFGEEQTRGFYLRDFGYYIGLNDYWDAELRGSIFSKGSYEGSLAARYRKNYKYDGNLNFRYAYTKIGIEGPDQAKSKDFNLQWSHSQRQEANPGTTFSASVNFGTSSYFSATGASGTYDPAQITRNSMSSNISYGKTIAGGLFNFTSSLSHRQDIATRDISLDLPTFNLSMMTINPFDSKNRVGEQKWYQRISLGYNLQGANRVSTKDTLLFGEHGLKNFTNGFQHSIPVSLSLNVLKYLQFNSSVNYNERWYFQTFRQHYEQDSLVRDTVSGFRRAYEYTLSSGFSTKIYGQKNFRKGNLVALRHVMTPSVSFNYRPDFGQSKYGYFDSYINPATGRRQVYSVFDGTLYGGPGRGRQAGIGFSLDNNIEAKVRSKSDTATTEQFEKIPIIQGLNFSGSYNFAAENFKLSPINFSGRTALFKQKFGINFGGTFDPYAYKLDSLGQRIDEYAIKTGKLARLTNFRLSFDFSLNSSTLKERNEKIDQERERPGITPEQQEQLNMISRNPHAFVDFNVPWNISASYSFNYSKPDLRPGSVTNTLNFSGDFSVTPKWKVQYSSGYDFKMNDISYTQFSIYRDLHCWDMSFNWVPFGRYRSYSVDLRVRASILQDLKLSKRRSYLDNY